MIFSNCVNWILSTDKDSAQRWTLSSTPHNNDSDSAEPVIISKKQQGPNLPHKLISSHYFLPLLPSNTQVSQAQLAAAYYGAVDFLAYLVDFLWCIDTNSPTLPHPISTIGVIAGSGGASASPSLRLSFFPKQQH